MRSMGSKGVLKLKFFPCLGGGDPAYDYLGVSAFKNLGLITALPMTCT